MFAISSIADSKEEVVIVFRAESRDRSTSPASFAALELDIVPFWTPFITSTKFSLPARAALQALAFGSTRALLGVDLGEGAEVAVGVGDGVVCTCTSSSAEDEHPASDDARKSIVAICGADAKGFREEIFT